MTEPLMLQIDAEDFKRLREAWANAAPAVVSARAACEQVQKRLTHALTGGTIDHPHTFVSEVMTADELMRERAANYAEAKRVALAQFDAVVMPVQTVEGL